MNKLDIQHLEFLNGEFASTKIIENSRYIVKVLDKKYKILKHRDSKINPNRAYSSYHIRKLIKSKEAIYGKGCVVFVR